MNQAQQAESDEQEVVRTGPRVPWGTLVKAAFGVAVLAFGAAYIAGRWDELRVALHGARPGWIVLAVAFAALGQYAAVFGFRAILTALQHRLGILAVARIYFVSQLGKYIPGAVWPIVAITEMSRRLGVSRRAAALSGVLGMIFSMVVGGLVGIVLVLVGAAQRTPQLWWLLLALPVAVLAVHPRVVAAAVRIALRVTRRESVEFKMHGAALRGSLGWPAVSWVLLGLQCWALVVALGGPVASSLAGAVGGFALAYVAGTLFVPAPAGVGVREAVLGVALTGVVSHSGSFTHDKVVLVVLLSRILLALLDFGQAALTAGLWRLSLASRRDGMPVAGK
ncbi:MAG: glycosyltransferase 2 family protein [Pseudonocardiales bacterium]|nr:glycosyltransferase 2 family protein [Pseudonocardiales bacterium]